MPGFSAGIWYPFLNTGTHQVKGGTVLLNLDRAGKRKSFTVLGCVHPGSPAYVLKNYVELIPISGNNYTKKHYDSIIGQHG